MKKLNFGISRNILNHGCGVTSRGYMPIFSPIGLPGTEQDGLKVYLVSYTNKTGNLEAVFEKSYFQPTQKPKSPICYPYGPTKLSGKS